MENIYVLIVDDQVLFAESLETVLTMRSENIRVAGIASNGQEAVDMAGSLPRVDLILMDVRMPGMDGVKAAGIIRKKYPHIKVIMLTTFKDDEYVFEALQYGISGYMLKNTPVTELIATIQAARDGAIQISPDVADALVRRSQPETAAGSGAAGSVPIGRGRPEWLGHLSSREKEILQLMAEGFDNRTISERLFLAPQTIKNHVSQIYSKIGTHDRMQAVRLVSQCGCDLRLM